MKIILSLFSTLCFFCSCKEYKSESRRHDEAAIPAKVTGQYQKSPEPSEEIVPLPTEKDTIVDANYRFEEAIAGSKAPQSIIDQLTHIEHY